MLTSPEVLTTSRTLVVLAANFTENGNGYEFPDVQDGLALGGDYRLKAAAALYKHGVVDHIIVNGGVNEQYGVPISEVQKQHLTEKYNVPKEAITTTNEAEDPEYTYNTLGDIRYLKKFLAEEDSPLVMTSRYHVPRSEALFNKLGLELPFISAEDVLEIYEPQEKEKIDVFYTSRAMALRMHWEDKGLEDLLNGNYKGL